MSAVILRDLRAYFDEARVRAGEMIAREGELCHQLVVVIQGELTSARCGQEVILRTGDSYGWQAMDERGFNNATIVARTDALLLVMGHAQFRAVAALSQEKRPAAWRSRPWKTRASGELDAVRPRPLLTWLDLETDTLPARQRVEVDARVETGPVKEVLLPVFGRDESETAVGDQLLDGPCRHRRSPLLES
jgi:signal-transduction protein with cAMP-binding, CBS, and nucleotidyltransferase domain